MGKFEEIIKKAQGIKLRPQEKSDIRARLYAVEKGEAAQSSKSVVQSLGWRFLRPAPILASLMVALLAGGGVSFASENSLPGELLYPIKIAINEEVRAKLAFSDEAKAGWEAQRADRRLAEAEKLSEKGMLTSEQQERIQIAFDKHATAAQSGATQKVSEKIEKIARKHEKIIARINRPAVKAGAVSAASLMADTGIPAVAAKALIHEESRSAQESTLEFTAAAVAEIAEKKISEIDDASERAGWDPVNKVLIEGREKLEEGRYGESIILFRKASRLADGLGSPLKNPDEGEPDEK